MLVAIMAAKERTSCKNVGYRAEVPTIWHALGNRPVPYEKSLAFGDTKR